MESYLDLLFLNVCSPVTGEHSYIQVWWWCKWCRGNQVFLYCDVTDVQGIVIFMFSGFMVAFLLWIIFFCLVSLLSLLFYCPLTLFVFVFLFSLRCYPFLRDQTRGLAHSLRDQEKMQCWRKPRLVHAPINTFEFGECHCFCIVSSIDSLICLINQLSFL